MFNRQTNSSHIFWKRVNTYALRITVRAPEAHKNFSYLHPFPSHLPRFHVEIVSGRALTEAYAMNNLSVGIKFSVFRGLLIRGNALIAVDDNGLRAKIVPLVGVSYKF
jgi:hypothetical protein